MLTNTEYDFLSNVSIYLQNFRVRSMRPYKANFRCPVCGDSKTNERKTRGWFLENSDFIHFYCHNCNASMRFENFLKEHFPSLYIDFRRQIAIEKLKNSGENKENSFDQIEQTQKNTKYKLKNAIKVSSLPHWHMCKKYVDSRKIPPYNHHRLFYTEDFCQFVHQYDETKLEKMKPHSRLLMPLFDRENNLIGIQGRSFVADDSMRYITIMFDESQPKIFGLEQVSFNKKYYATEGPIDSLFLPNSIAMAGASLDFSALDNIEKCVVIFDNDKRNLEICNSIEKVIDKKLKVCIWPKDLQEKDLNDIVLSGKIKNLKKFVDDHTFSGMKAKIRFVDWRRKTK